MLRARLLERLQDAVFAGVDDDARRGQGIRRGEQRADAAVAEAVGERFAQERGGQEGREGGEGLGRGGRVFGLGGRGGEFVGGVAEGEGGGGGEEEVDY